MKKKEIKEFFKAIADGDIAAVSGLITANREYITVCNVAPPKKDDGQSGLQVAFKTGNFDVAKVLIEQGADVNFIETSAINDWRAPVLHDCIRATMFNSYTLQKDTAKFDKAFALLTLMLEKKANPNSVDSYGNNCMHRAVMDARQMIDNPAADFTGNILITQIRSVFSALISYGADINADSEKRPPAAEMARGFGLIEYRLW